MRRRDKGLGSRRAHTSLGIAPEGDSDAGSMPFSNGDDVPAEPIYGAKSWLPQIRSYHPKQNERSALSNKVKQGLLDPIQYHIYAESYGGVEFYKRMARKAESAMQMEQKQYHFDLERNNELISRLKARISALEALCDEKESLLETQRRKNRMFRHHLQYNSKTYEKDLAHVRSMLESTDKRLAMVTEESKRKAVEMRHELMRKDSALETYQNDMAEISKCVEEPLESFYLPDYLSPKIGQLRKTEGMKIAAKILRIRAEHDDMMRSVRSRDAETSSLVEEVKHLRKGADEISKLRETAASSLKTLEGMAEKLRGLDRIVTSSSLLKGVEDAVLPEDKSQDKITALFNRLRGMLQMLVSKAEAASKTTTVLQSQHDKCGSLIAQIQEDLGLSKPERSEDIPGLLSAIREHMRRKLDTLQNLQKEKSSADAAVTKNASKTRQLERSIEELTLKQRTVKAEKDRLEETLSIFEKGNAALEKQLLHLQKLFVTISSSLQSGNYGTIREAVGGATAIKTAEFDEQKQVEAIVTCFESLVTEKSRLETKIKKGNDQVLELVEMFGKPEKKVDASDLSSVISKVVQLKKDNEIVANKLKTAENELEDVGRKKTSQLDSTLQQVGDLCGDLRTQVRNIQSVFGVATEGPKVKGGALTELGQIAAELSTLVPKVLDLKKERESLVTKLADNGKKGQEERSLRQDTEKHLSAIRQGLKAIQSACPAELGKSSGESEAEEIALLEKIKQELLSANESKQKAVGRAQSLSLQASQLDPVMVELCAGVQNIQRDLGGGTSLALPQSHDASVRLEYIRDKLKEVRAAITAKAKAMSEEVDELKGKVKFLEGVIKNSERKWSERVELVNKEIRRLGGCDIDNKVENAKKQEAAARVKEFILRAKQTDDASTNPLSKLAVFQVDLLVNNKVHTQLQVGGAMNGLFQAAVHYFKIESRSGEITFENAAVPGSQSSNMLVELVLQPVGNSVAYESKAGDVLGLCVKVKAVDDETPREILYNSSVIHTDEVMDAIKGQTIDNFSLWPDLVSSWRWERSPSKGWTLVTVKWRFLLKSIFPELSEPLQVLAIANRPVYDRSQTIRML